MRADRVPDVAVGEAVEAGRPDQREEHRGGPGERLELPRAEQRRPQRQPSPAPVERRQRADHREVDREAVGAVGPGLDPERGHPGQLERSIYKGQDRQQVGVVFARVDELEPGEGDQRRGRRVAADLRRIGTEERPRLAPRRPQHRRPGAADGPPRVERPEDVAEEGREDRDPDPEDDVHRGRREVRGEVLFAPQPGVDDDREDADADRPAGPFEGPRNGQQLVFRDSPQPALAQAEHREEGDHDDHRRRPGEEPGRDRQIRPPDDPVRGGRPRPEEGDRREGGDERCAALQGELPPNASPRRRRRGSPGSSRAPA